MTAPPAGVPPVTAPTPGELLLVIGGARSGKSRHAEALGHAAGPAARVLFAATAEAHDDDMRRRIARHRADRPAGWATVEAPLALPEALAAAAGARDLVIVDCLTLWVSNLLLRHEGDADLDARVAERVEALLAVRARDTAAWVVVTNEVGLGVVPGTPLGRHYRDLLGRANQQVAARADRVRLLVAGIAVAVKG